MRISFFFLEYFENGDPRCKVGSYKTSWPKMHPKQKVLKRKSKTMKSFESFGLRGLRGLRTLKSFNSPGPLPMEHLALWQIQRFFSWDLIVEQTVKPGKVEKWKIDENSWKFQEQDFVVYAFFFVSAWDIFEVQQWSSQSCQGYWALFLVSPSHPFIHLWVSSFTALRTEMSFLWKWKKSCCAMLKLRSC